MLGEASRRIDEASSKREGLYDIAELFPDAFSALLVEQMQFLRRYFQG
jgi:hypothetical protein